VRSVGEQNPCGASLIAPAENNPHELLAFVLYSRAGGAINGTAGSDGLDVVRGRPRSRSIETLVQWIGSAADMLSSSLFLNYLHACDPRNTNGCWWAISLFK